LADLAMYFASCGKSGKFMVPVGNAYPFLMMMGKVILAWLLFWEAGVAKEKLDALCNDPLKLAQLVKSDKDAAFYAGKFTAAKYFIKHILPEIDAVVRAIKSDDLSIMEIAEESFVS
jgi:hypothetical protein